MNPMVKAILSFSPLSEKSLAELEEITNHHFIKKNTQLLEIGQISYYLYFIVKGLGRVYYVRDGVDITDYFAMDGNFIGGVESIFTGKPSHKAIETLEDSEIYTIKNKDFEELCTKFHDIERAGRKLAIFAFLVGQKRIESIRFLSAKERYDELEKQFPGIVNRAPLKHIASYLGTTQVSISRIRAGLQ